MKPFQYKMATGSTYVGFPGPIDNTGMFELTAGCMMVYVTAEQRFDIRGLMISTSPSEVNLSSVQARQELIDETDYAMGYCRYLGSLIAAMEIGGIPVPLEVQTYVDYMNPYFQTQFDGVGIWLAGRYDYAVSTGSQEAPGIKKSLEQVAKEYRSSSTATVEKACVENVVHLQFGSKKNASEEEG